MRRISLVSMNMGEVVSSILKEKLIILSKKEIRSMHILDASDV